MAPNLPTKLALEPEFNWVVGCKLALKPEFCCLPLILGGANMTSSVALSMLRPMAVRVLPPGDAAIVLAFAAAVAIGIPPGDEGIALAFSATAAAAIVGGGDGFCDIIASLGEKWV